MKKITSILLAVVMIFGVFAVMPLSAGAAGNTFVYAEFAGIGNTVCGTFSEGAKNEEYYRFSVNVSGRLTLTVRSDIEICYKIYEKTNTAAEIVCDFALFSDETVELTAGDYFMVITPRYSYEETGHYQITLGYDPTNETAAESIGDLRNSFTKAAAIAFDKNDRTATGDITGQIAVNDREDYYAFTLASPGTLTFTADADSETVYDFYEYNKTKDPVASVIDSAITFGKKFTGHIAQNDPQDYYRFSLSKATKVYLSFNAAQSLEIRVIDRNDTYGSVFYRAESFVNESFDLAAGDYFIEVSEFIKHRGAYDFTLSEVIVPTSVSLNKTKLTLIKGKIARLTATVAPYNAADKTVTWSSDRSYVASVSKNGAVSAKAPGTAKITAETANGLKLTKKGVQITVKRVAGAAKYRIFRRSGHGKWIKLADTAKSYVDKKVNKGVTYQYAVYCLDKKNFIVSAGGNAAQIRYKR